MPQPDWFNKTVYERVKQLSLIVHPRYKIFAPWALTDEMIRIIGGKHFQDVISDNLLKKYEMKTWAK